jgi:hypothetical protein
MFVVLRLLVVVVVTCLFIHYYSTEDEERASLFWIGWCALGNISACCQHQEETKINNSD